MKKILLFAAVAACLTLTSCGKSAADYVKESEKLHSEYTELISEGKTEEAAKVEEKIEKLTQEVKERCQKDPEFAKELLKEAFSHAGSYLD